MCEFLLTSTRLSTKITLVLKICTRQGTSTGGTVMENLYENIVLLCEKAGIKPGRLCDELGISRGLMTDLKMGRKKTVNAETAQKIAGFFGVSVAYLLGREAEAGLLDQVDVAFYGEYKELSNEEKETVRDMVRLMRQRRAQKQKE